MSKCKNLEILTLHKNQIKNINDSLANCSNLKTLEIHSNALEIPPNFLSKLKKLSPVLNLQNNQLSTLTPEMTEMVWLSEINLEGNQFTEIPPGFEKLNEIQKLNFSKNKITTINENLKHLTEL